MRLTVVVVVDGECTEVVTAVREWDGVAVLFPEGEWEETECLFLRVKEV